MVVRDRRGFDPKKTFFNFSWFVIVYRLPFFDHLMSVCLISVSLIAGVTDTDFLGKAEKSERHVRGGQD